MDSKKVRIVSLLWNNRNDRKLTRGRRFVLADQLGGSLFECLETRQLLTSYFIDNLSDDLSGSGSNGTLRWAVQQANMNPGDDSIEFQLFSWPRTITLNASNGAIVINDSTGGNLAINGLGRESLTISGGNATGIFHVRSPLSVKNLAIKFGNGVNLPNGGAIFNNHSSVIMDQVDIANNTASAGGAVFVDSLFGGSNLSITNSRIADNSATDGGVLYVWGDYGIVQATISNCVLTDNNATSKGGAINIEGGSGLVNLFLSDSTLGNNTATSGGALRIYTNNMVSTLITNSCFTLNKASYGGAIYSEQWHGVSNLSISSSLFASNSASQFGGAIENMNSRLDLTGSDFSGNSARYGGAIFCEATLNELAQVIISGSSLANNTSSYGGGGVCLEAYYGTVTLDMLDSIFSKNASVRGGAIFSDGSDGNLVLAFGNSTFENNNASFGGAFDSDTTNCNTTLNSNSSFFLEKPGNE